VALVAHLTQLLSDLPPQVTISEYENANQAPYRRDEDSPTYSGSFGAVQKFTDVLGREVYARKELSVAENPRPHDGKTGTKQMISEITMLRKCTHPNVLRLVEVYRLRTIEDRFFLVTKPWAPLTLADFFEKLLADGDGMKYKFPWWKGFPATDPMLHIYNGLLQGLHYLHAHSIKHKDLNPRNILLHEVFNLADEQPHIQPIIADFGISKLYRPEGRTMFTDATYMYLAPEQISNTESGLKADMFSMGCCLLLLFAAACKGGSGVVEIENSVTNHSASCQYGREVQRIRQVLYNMIREQDNGASSHQHSRLVILGLVVRDMLLENPEQRPATASVLSALDPRSTITQSLVSLH
jgi:serine/threonine protein kinase